MVHAILRLYSYAVQLVISLLCLALGLVAAMSGNVTFDLEMLPWSGDTLWKVLLALGVTGVAATVLAFKGKLRILFVLWTLGTVFLLGRGIFASPYRFDGESEFKWALFLLLCVLLTVCGAWSRFKQKV